MGEKKAIGIIGGMGPLATCDIYEKIILHTDAQTDQEHLRIYIDNHAEVPNRTESILYGGENPVPYIVESGKKLISIGAQLLIMACNTSHFYIEEIQNQLSVPVVSMIEATKEIVEKRKYQKVALLATEGTTKTQIYQRALKDYEVLLPDEKQQKIVTDVIYKGVKAGKDAYDAREFQKLVSRMQEDGAQSIILGCTELPLAVKSYHIEGQFIDPTLELAKKIIVMAGGKVKE